MRKPLLVLSLALAAGIGTSTAAGALAAPNGTNPSPPTLTANQHSSSSVSGAQIVQTALRYLGSRYTLTGNSPATGFSCIGFASYVYRANGIALPGDLGGAYAFAPKVAFSQLQPGDLLYFANTVWPGLSHVAIYLGGGRFVHAEWYNRGVVISSFTNDPVDGNYWTAKYMGANRPWTGAALAPVVVPPTSATSPTSPTSPALTTPPTAPSAPTRTAAPLQTTVPGGQPATVTVGALYLRSGPSKSYGQVTVLARGTTMTIVGRLHGWLKVQLVDGTVGWVVRAGTSAHVARANPTVPATSALPTIGQQVAPVRAAAPTVRRPTAAIRASGLRVHVGPSLASSVVSTVGRGQRVQVLIRRNGWVKVRTPDGMVGWVLGAYTSVARRHVVTSGVPVTGTSRQVRTTRAVVRARVARHGPVLSAGVRLHAAPRLSGRVLGLAGAGTHVTVLRYAGAWLLIRLPNGQTGYVASVYVHS